MALIAARAGRLNEAQARLSTVVPSLADAPRDSEWLPMLAQIAEIVAATGPHPVAEQVREWLEPYADLQVVEGIGAVVRGPVRDFLALLGVPVSTGNVFRRDGDMWLVGFAGQSVRLTASKGLQDLAQLISRPGQQIAAERDALVTSLTSAYGLGGRARRTGSSAERARSAVTARIRATIDRIGKIHPTLGRHLANSVRTGTFCVYHPETPVTWDLTP